MYQDIIEHLNVNNKYHNIWPFDQYYISEYVFNKKKDFVIFIPNILNTPIGKILRHNWFKNNKMYDDLNHLCSLKNEDLYNNKILFAEKDLYDKEIFPNINIEGYKY